jgi:large subunit ribosomal protein L27
MAHKKAGGSTKNGRDSNPKYRGIKRYDGQQVNAGEIIVRQVGQTWKAGKNVYLGKDFTVHAKVAGTVRFIKSMQKIAIEPMEDAA